VGVVLLIIWHIVVRIIWHIFHAGGLHVVCRDRLKPKILVSIRLPHKSPHDLQPMRQIISTEVRQIISQATISTTIGNGAAFRKGRDFAA
jgi:hypothetical protein